MQVPPQLNYNQLQSKAFFSVFKQWPVEPISNGGQYWPGQVIRIFLNALTDGVMDPYRSHIQITVSCDSTSLPVGLLQVDNSSQSFIQQIIISSKNRQIQRIVQYGILAAYLTDIGISQLYTQGKQIQGLGYSNIDNYASLYTNSYSTGNTATYQATNQNMSFTISTPGTINPTIPARFNSTAGIGTQSQPMCQQQGFARGHISPLNSAWLGKGQNQVWWWYAFLSLGQNTTPFLGGFRDASLDYYGYMNNLRAQYIASYSSNQYVDSTSSNSQYQIRLDPSVQGGSTNFPAKFNTKPYLTLIPQQINYLVNYSNQGGSGSQVFYASQIPNITSLWGFSSLYSPNFAKGVRQPFISPTVPQCQMQNGTILSQKVPVATRTFKIPLISSVIGLLIPKNQFVLLPLKALNDVLIEMTIDPYAMFTSGYNDVSEYDNVGMGLMQQRNFKITRLVYNLHTYSFWNAEMDQYLKVSLSTGIAINTKFWQLGNQYQIQNSQSLTNSWPVACNQQALNNILALFVPLDYQNLTFCRKHFRISNNVTKMQLRINMDYYPSQPLTGNGGNPIQLDSTGNNSVFIEQLYSANNYLFQAHKPLPRINNFNFAINDRCYNVYNTHTYYDIGMRETWNYLWNSTSINNDTAMGMSNIHQNRYVGKAAYAFSFEPYSHSKDFLTGIDCRAAKSFDLIFACNPQNWFPRAQSMYIYTCSSVIMQYNTNGIININK